MPWVEHTTSEGQGDRDVPGRGAIVRLFKVWDVTPGSVLRDPVAILNEQGVGLPALNSVHPELPGWFLDRYRLTTKESKNVAVFEADYSNTRRFYFREILDPGQEGHYSWGVSFRRESVEIPYAIRGRRELSRTPEPPVVMRPWEKQIWRAPINYTRITLTVNVPQFGGSQRRAVEAQNGRVHVIENLPYLYEAGDARQVDLNKWVIEHNWISDPGTGDSPFPNAVLFPEQKVHGPQSTYPSIIPSLPRTHWTRHPFFDVIGPLEPASENPEDPPLFENLRRHDFDPEGWRGLPGVSP